MSPDRRLHPFATTVPSETSWRSGSDNQQHPRHRQPSSATAPTPSTGSARGDLGLASTTSIPSCDGTGIVVLYSATNPNSYAEEVAAQLLANPGSQYLRTDNYCASLRQATTDGNPIYAVYRIAGTTEPEVCAAVTAPSGDSYGKWLDTTTDPNYTIPS